MSLPSIYETIYFYNPPIQEELTAWYYSVQEQLEDFHLIKYESVQTQLRRLRWWMDYEKYFETLEE